MTCWKLLDKIALISGLMFFVLIFNNKAISQEHVIKGNFHNFYLDHLGNIYLVNHNHALLKYDDVEKEPITINLKMLGDLASVNVTNPLELLLYYPSPNVVVFTDNTLSEKRRIELDELGFDQVSLVSRSTEQGIWIYDESEGDIKRISEEGEVLFESDPLYRYVRTNLDPIHLKEYGNRVYLNIPDHGILMFDHFGTYVKTIPLKGVRTFQVTNNVLSYWNGKDIGKFGLQSFTKKTLELPDKVKKENCKAVRHYNKNFYVLTESGLRIYKE